MPKRNTKMLCVNDLRHAEYYAMQKVFDELYERSVNGEIFTDLMRLILSRENILLAYRNIKTNSGSNTPGTDKITIKDIGKLNPEELVEKMRFIVQGSKHGYRPKPVRRKEIPKPNGSIRPLGIPCIWDRLIQQCIKQVMEPICEAKFSNSSYGFRPNRSVENAIAEVYKHMQRSHLHYVVEFDIKGFFDNVNHPKLIRQIWALGIRDKQLIYTIKQILKAPIRLPNGKTVYPEKGTPQGGIISPLLANIVLNELDKWIESQWIEFPVSRKYNILQNPNGSPRKSNQYASMRITGLKEMRIVRYADDFRIFCRTKDDAERTRIAVTQWLEERLKLEVSKEKTRVVNTRTGYSEFLGFKIKLYEKAKKYVVKSHISDKQLRRANTKLVEQAKRIAKPAPGNINLDEIRLYNAMVLGIQNYYQIATHIVTDFRILKRSTTTVLKNRLRNRFRKQGYTLTKFEKERYGKSAMLRCVTGVDQPIYPIGYIQHKNPLWKKRASCCYTPDGRKGLHDNLRINVDLLLKLMREPIYNKSVEYADNRISLFSAQWGKCAVTGKQFLDLDDIHCHHILPKWKGGTDAYSNLLLVSEPVHRLIHAVKEDTILKYKSLLNLNKAQMEKVNQLRHMAGLSQIA